jgi:hypothetical protein
MSAGRRAQNGAPSRRAGNPWPRNRGRHQRELLGAFDAQAGVKGAAGQTMSRQRRVCLSVNY